MCRCFKRNFMLFLVYRIFVFVPLELHFLCILPCLIVVYHKIAVSSIRAFSKLLYCPLPCFFNAIVNYESWTTLFFAQMSVDLDIPVISVTCLYGWSFKSSSTCLICFLSPSVIYPVSPGCCRPWPASGWTPLHIRRPWWYPPLFMDLIFDTSVCLYLTASHFRCQYSWVMTLFLQKMKKAQSQSDWLHTFSCCCLFSMVNHNSEKIYTDALLV